MSVLLLFVIIVLIGLVVWFVETYIPQAAPFKMLLRVVAVLVAIMIVLQAFGVMNALTGLRVGR